MPSDPTVPTESRERGAVEILFTQIHDRLSSLEAAHNEHLGPIHSKVGELQGRVGELQGTVSQVDKRVGNLGKRLRHQERRSMAAGSISGAITGLGTALAAIFGKT